MAVEAVLQANEIPYLDVQLGWAKLAEELSSTQRKAVEHGLAHYGLELMADKKKILVERIKTEIISLLHSPQSMRLKLSAHLSNVLEYNYTYLANTFSELEGQTLERYFITQRVERVKELMVYENFSLNRIADELNFSSVSHLGQQFKKVAGITPAEFRKQCQMDEFIWRKI
jgi:YesN/AraC family two-component response regulator